MGFYSKDNKERKDEKAWSRGPTSTWKWVGTVVLSAIVGSGATLGLSSVMAAHSTSLSAPFASTPAVAPTSVETNVNVSDAVTKVVQQVTPAVMAVVNYQEEANSFSGQSSLQEYGVGTGVYFYSDGKYAYIVTNNHVVQDSSQLEVVLSSGKHVKATVVGTDQFTDLAVIKVPLSNLSGVSPARFANSDDLQVGEPAIAIGTPEGLDFTESVTEGIVSAAKRIMPVEDPDSQQTLDYQTVIQTDAAINPGNSGGPLLNVDGEVMGINSSKIVETDVQGMGFAIPANEVETIANELLKTGHAVHPALGIEEESLSDLPQPYWPNVPVQYGVVVEQVDSSEAKAAGLEPQDVIVSIDGQSIQDDADLRTDIFKDQPGQTVKLVVYRGQKKLNLAIKLTTMQSPNTTDTGSNANSQSTSQSGSSNGSNPYDSSGGSGSYGASGNGGSSSDGNPFGGSGSTFGGF